MSLTFRWLGVAGVELKAGHQVLALDPFFTRPSLPQLIRTLKPDPNLASKNLPVCQVVLITHAHYDHLMDVPEVLSYTGATAYGSANTCQLLGVLGVPERQVKQVQPGDRLALGAFQVDVIGGRHSPLPFGKVFNGSLRKGLQPPLRAWDYRMDVCLGYCISVMGLQLLVCAAEPLAADILLAVAQESRAYYLKLFKGVRPKVFIPIHWDNFTRPLSKPLHRVSRPGGLALWRLASLARQVLPRVNVIIPEIFKKYSL